MITGEEGARVRVAILNDTYSFAIDGIAIGVRMRFGNSQYRSMHIQENGFVVWEDTETGSAASPTMYLPDEVARGLLQALMNHYQGAEDLRTVRGDLLHERSRVDKLINVTAELAEKALDGLIEN